MSEKAALLWDRYQVKKLSDENLNQTDLSR